MLMNFDKPGWLDRYLAFRRQSPLPLKLPTAGVQLFARMGVHNEQDQATFAFLQPTGLLYGFPINPPLPELVYPDQRYLDDAGRVHLIWLDALFACLVADRQYLLAGVHDESDPFGHALRAVSYFFQNVEGDPPERLAGAVHRVRKLVDRLPIGRNRPKHPELERAISRRVRPGGDILHLPEFAYNGFLFLDLYYCLALQRATIQEPSRLHAHLVALRAQQKEVRDALLRLLIAAAHSSGGVDDLERRVFDRFLSSAGLPSEERETFTAAMAQGLTLDQIEIPEAPWLVRRHLLDLTLMLILADRQFESSEQAFAADLVRRMGLWEEELEQSQSALEQFLVANERTLHFLRGRTQVQLLTERLSNRVHSAVRKNLDRIVNEINETRELYELLVKSRSQELTAEEKRKVRLQLFDILKTVPTLAIFAMPGGSMLLPVLIRLLPFNLLPTSFED
jgi:hypothetical protein